MSKEPFYQSMILNVECYTYEQIQIKLTDKRYNAAIKSFPEFCIKENGKRDESEYYHHWTFINARQDFVISPEDKNGKKYWFFDINYVEECLQTEMENYCLSDIDFTFLTEVGEGLVHLVFELQYSGTGQWLSGDCYDEVSLDTYLVGYYKDFKWNPFKEKIEWKI